MNYFLLLLFALAPSFVWLAFYLRKDSHPEPNGMIIRIFLAGMLVTIPAIYLETFLEGFISAFPLSHIGFLIVYFVVGIALVEEILKYLVVRFGVFTNSALDEPLDLMLYMIISALGFAAFENTLLLFKLVELYPASDIFLVNTIRFMQAIFLHAIVSGIFGYFLALSAVRSQTSNAKKSGFKQSPLLFFTGLGIATLLHGVFNLYIFTVGDRSLELLFLPIIPLLLLSVLVSAAFQRLKNLKTLYAVEN